MQVSLTIIRYPRLCIPFAFFAMAIHRLPLSFNKKISFYKLMGSGKNGTFNKVPDLQQWAILTVQNLKFDVHDPKEISGDINKMLKELYGGFIAAWFRLFRCETWTVLLEPISGHGRWDGKEVFGSLPHNAEHSGLIAILTRATIRFNKLKYFWQHVAPVATRLKESKGFIISAGIGEIPWIKQATFSIWETKEDMMAFAYGLKEHADVIKKTREQQWYSEEMFIRFRITCSNGTIRGIDPLKGKLYI